VDNPPGSRRTVCSASSGHDSRRLQPSCGRSGLKVEVWHLVTPWDPSPEAELWLQGLGETYGVTAVWDGLTTVDQLAAKYPDVVDYYLYGGRARIEEMYHQLAALFAVGKPADGLDVPTVDSMVEKALATLAHDPHYRYEHRFGAGTVPSIGDRPNLVTSYVKVDTAAGNWTIVDVIARCAASVEERPITISGELHLEPGSVAEDSYHEFTKFGAPFTSGEGAFAGEVDAPGGLGGPLEGATISISGILEIGDNPELFLEVLNPEGVVLAGVNLNRIERSQGQAGVRVVLEEENRVFTLEDRYNLADLTGCRTLRFGEIEGKPVSAVAAAVDFLTHCSPPNIGRLSIRHTPPELGRPDANIGLLQEDEPRQHVMQFAKLLGLFSTLQKASSTVITVPDFDDLPPGQIHDWRFAAARCGEARPPARTLPVTAWWWSSPPAPRCPTATSSSRCH
jgi:hypothetical protein